MYKLNTFAGQVAKNWERAVRRHPPTTCTRCSEDLVWFVPGGCYLTKEEIYDGREQSCAYHLPANGKRAHRYA